MQILFIWILFTSERIKVRLSLPCNHSKTRDETIMKNYIKTFLLLPCLVSGLVEERAGNDMEISDRRQCYVFGQCQVNFIYTDGILTFSFKHYFNQEYSVNFQASLDAESCHKFCGGNKGCEWWSWEPEQTLCILFANCTDSGHPDTGPCPDCISGQRL